MGHYFTPAWDLKSRDLRPKALMCRRDFPILAREITELPDIWQRLSAICPGLADNWLGLPNIRLGLPDF